MQFSEIYDPQEDSYFMERKVLEFAKGNVLDMGTGSGIQALAALSKRNVDSVVGVDISKKAIEQCKKLSRRITWLESNLFKNLNSRYHNYFDTIIFNAPYLPQQSKKRLVTVEAGRKGFEIILEFLEQARPFLRPKSMIMLLFSSLSKPDIILNFADTQLYDNKLLGVKSLFFEELYIYQFNKNPAFLELQEKGIKDIKFFDKGWRGLIHKAKYKNKIISIKTKRKLSEAKNAIKNEIKWLKFANKHNIGPNFVLNGKNFLAYEFVSGKTFDKWILTANKTQLKSAIRNILEQCNTLDKLKVNKEELHRPLTNVIVSRNKPILIDFERMYKTKKPHNVTQFCQFLINRLNFFRKKKFTFTKNKIIALASKYKKEHDNLNFKNIIEMIK